MGRWTSELAEDHQFSKTVVCCWHEGQTSLPLFMHLLWIQLTLCWITITYSNKPIHQTRTLWIGKEYPETCEVKSLSSGVDTSHRESQCLWVCKTSQSFVVRFWNQTGSGLFGLLKRGSLAIRSHWRQSLCLRDSMNSALPIKGLSRTPPPFFVAPSFTLLSVVCLSVLCYVAFPSPVCHGWLCSLFVSLPPLLMPSFSFIWLFRAVEISQLMHQSHCRLVT